MAIVEPGAPDPSWPRFSDRPFPPYRFVPGLTPHPRRDPKGHAYGTSELPPPSVSPSRWRENATYLYGVDLYNHAYWWECHEALEGLWHLTGHQGTESQFLQGIIQLAAAFVHLMRHEYPGTSGLLSAALEKLEGFPAEYMGIDVARLAAEARRARDELAALGPERFEEWDKARIPQIHLIEQRQAPAALDR
jgi:hypothetical protein